MPPPEIGSGKSGGVDADKRKNILIIILLCFAGLLIYFNSLGNNFVYDDLVVVRDNSHLDNLRNLKSFFSSDYFVISGERTYRPVTTALAFLDVAIAGRTPLIFRMTSIAIHLLNGIFIFLILMALTGRRPLSALAALFFLLHPIQTEAVDGISFVEDPLSAMFFFAAFMAYLKYRAGKRPAAFYVLSVALYLLAVFSKESAAMLPIVIALAEWAFRGEEPAAAALRVRWKPLAGYAAATAFYLFIRFSVLANKLYSAPAKYPGGDFLHTIPMTATAFLEYIRLFFYPAGLSIEHCFAGPFTWTSAYVLGGAAMFAAILVFGVLMRRTDPVASFGALFFLLCLLPVSNILPFGALMAERYLYLPSFGLCLFTVAMLMQQGGKGGSANRRLEKWNIVFVVCFTMIYSGFTVQRNFAWRDDLYLWKSALKVCPTSSRAHTNYARRLLEVTTDPAMIRKAASHLESAALQDPDHYEALLALGAAYTRLGRPLDAEKIYLEAYRVHPTNDVRYNIALLYNQTGAPRRALKYLFEIAVTQPNWLESRYLLGNTFLKIGELERARAEYLFVLAADPNHIGAKGNLGVVAFKTGDLQGAERIFRDILAKHPGNEYAAKNLSRTLEMKKNSAQRR
jgi:protein O-mannosyl-transferase